VGGTFNRSEAQVVGGEAELGVAGVASEEPPQAWRPRVPPRLRVTPDMGHPQNSLAVEPFG